MKDGEKKEIQRLQNIWENQKEGYWKLAEDISMTGPTALVLVATMGPAGFAPALLGVGAQIVTRRGADFFADLEKKRKAKKIDEEKLTAESLHDLMKFLTEFPDEATWNVIKTLFLKTLEDDLEDAEEASIYEFMNVAKKLSGTEIRILAASYRIMKTPDNGMRQREDRSCRRWAQHVASLLHFNSSEEALRYEKHLEEEYLISPHENVQGTVMETWYPTSPPNSWHRLTTFGMNFAEYVGELE